MKPPTTIACIRVATEVLPTLLLRLEVDVIMEGLDQEVEAQVRSEASGNNVDMDRTASFHSYIVVILKE
jgi:hypothetical protein